MYNCANGQFGPFGNRLRLDKFHANQAEGKNAVSLSGRKRWPICRHRGPTKAVRKPGYQFESPRDIARFVDCFCLGLHEWLWALEVGDLRVYALAPFSTLSSSYPDAPGYSTHARSTAKRLHGGDSTFWGRLLAAIVYLSGLADQIDYVTAYPGHSTKSPDAVIRDALTILSDSLIKKFIPDLLLRHKTATKSKHARASGGMVDHLNQINTIH
jgi:hypothetical protein